VITAPTSADIEDVKLPMIFIFTGLILFVFAQVILAVNIGHLAKGLPGVPMLLSAAHLTLLGFATMVAMGAMYQLVPVALQVKLKHRRLTYPQYLLYAMGVLGLSFGLFVFNTSMIAIFGILTVTGVIVFVFHMMSTIRDAEKGPIKSGVFLALLFLFLTVLLGLTLALDFFRPYLGSWHEVLFHVHILFGTIGWFTLLIIGLSFKLAPMFTLSHKYESRYGPLSIHLIHAGIWVMTLGFLLKQQMLSCTGAAVILLGFLCYGVQMKKVLDNRLKKKYDLGIRVSLFALPFSLVMLAALGAMGFVMNHAVPVPALVYLIIIGWISLVIFGYLFKIIPFLWWTYKYGERAGQKGVPLLKDMMNEQRGKWWFLILIGSIVLIAASLVTGLSLLAQVFQVLFVMASMAYTIEMANVLRK
jgi:hypothetical protein